MSTRLSRVALPLVALVSGVLACGANPEPAQVSQGIFGGVDDTVHTGVVGISIFHNNGLGICTGSLITPTLVLTARHCVSPVGDAGVACSTATINGVARTVTLTQANYDPSAFRVTTAANIGLIGRNTGVVEVLTPPGSTGVALCGRDIALLRLASPITTVPLMRPRLDIIARVNNVFTASGYGSTSSASTGSGQRRMRDGLKVQYVGRAFTRGVVILEDQELLADTGTCHGDSGGPAIDLLGDVFGVLSRGGANCDSPIYTRVDSHAAWIRAQAARVATLDRYAPPAWVTPPDALPGAQGDGCSGDNQCDLPLACQPTGPTRECTTDNCDACPDGWICDETGPRCVRDPSVTPPPPPPPPDAGSPADAGPTDDAAAPADAAPTTAPPPAAAAASGCDVGAPRRSAGAGELTLLALAAAAGVRRRRG